MKFIICFLALSAVSAAASAQQQPNDYQSRRQQFQDQRGNFGRRNRGNNSFDPSAGSFSGANQGDDIPVPPAMTGTWLIFQDRSIFFKGQFSRPQVQPDYQSPVRASMVFIGVFDAGTTTKMVPTAFLEDNISGQVTPVRVGDQIAEGKVTAINLDTMEYLSGGRTLHLDVGDNLAGQQMWGGPTTMPLNLDFSGPSGDVLKQMAQRRLKELNGGVTAPSGK